MLPPSCGAVGGCVTDGADAGVIFGPVHASEETLLSRGFASILAPAPYRCLDMDESEAQDLPRLVWINVFKCRNGRVDRGVHWCSQVPEDIVSQWRQNGWQDVYFDQ